MNNDIFSPLESLPYFTIEAVRQLIDQESAAAGSLPTHLYRWVKAGKLIRLKKGVYMSRRFFEAHRADADFAPAVSMILIPQSYVSLEYVLQRHGIVGEVTQALSAVTFKQTRVIENRMGVFAYRHIKPGLYQGFEIADYLGIPFAMASAAKALFDALYLRPLGLPSQSRSFHLAEDLRLNLDEFPSEAQAQFAYFVETSQSSKMQRILENLRRTVWRH